jgi:hypothetical protein
MKHGSENKANADYRRLRSALILRGVNLRQFALNNGYRISTVYDAARGSRAGIVATKIRRELETIAYA